MVLTNYVKSNWKGGAKVGENLSGKAHFVDEGGLLFTSPPTRICCNQIQKQEIIFQIYVLEMFYIL